MRGESEALAGSVDRLASSIESSVRHGPGAERAPLAPRDRTAALDVVALTEREVDELRLLLANSERVSEFAESRARRLGSAVTGMYQEFGRIGLVACGRLGGVVAVLPLASWAVEKHDQRKLERLRDEERAEAHDREMARIAARSGVLGAVLGSVAGALATALLSLIQSILQGA